VSTGSTRTTWRWATGTTRRRATGSTVGRAVIGTARPAEWTTLRQGNTLLLQALLELLGGLVENALHAGVWLRTLTALL